MLRADDRDSDLPRAVLLKGLQDRFLAILRELGTGLTNLSLPILEDRFGLGVLRMFATLVGEFPLQLPDKTPQLPQFFLGVAEILPVLQALNLPGERIHGRLLRDHRGRDDLDLTEVVRTARALHQPKVPLMLACLLGAHGEISRRADG